MSKNLLDKYSPTDKAKESTRPLSSSGYALSMAAVGKESANLASLIDRTEGLIGDYTGLETVVATLESLGEPDQASLQYAGVAFGRYTKELSISGESSGNGKDVTLEGMAIALKNLWAAVRKAVDGTSKAIHDFFSKIYQSIDKVAVRLKQFKEEVRKLGSDKPNYNSKVTIPNPEKIMFSGNSDVPAIVKGLKSLQNVTGEVYGHFLKAVEADVDKHIGAIQSMDRAKSPSEESAILQDVEKSRSDVVKAAKSSIEGKIVSGDMVYRSEVSTNPKDLGMFKINLLSSHRHFTYSGVKDLETLSTRDMDTLLTICISTLEKMKAGKRCIDNIKARRDDGLKIGDNIIKNVDDNKDSSVWSRTTNRALLTQLQYDSIKPVTQLASHTFHVLRNIISMIENSIKNYQSNEVVDARLEA